MSALLVATTKGDKAALKGTDVAEFVASLRGGTLLPDGEAPPRGSRRRAAGSAPPMGRYGNVARPLLTQ